MWFEINIWWWSSKHKEPRWNYHEWHARDSHQRRHEQFDWHNYNNSYQQKTSSQSDRIRLISRRGELQDEIRELWEDLELALNRWDKELVKWYTKAIEIKENELLGINSKLQQAQNSWNYNSCQQENVVIYEHKESLPWSVSIQFLDWIWIKQVIGKSEEEMFLKKVKEVSYQENYEHNSGINLINLWDTKEFDLTFNEDWSDLIKWRHIEKIRISYESWRIIIHNNDSEKSNIINVNNQNLKHGVYKIPIEKWFFELKIN